MVFIKGVCLFFNMVSNSLVPSGVVSGDYCFYFFVHKNKFRGFLKDVKVKGVDYAYHSDFPLNFNKQFVKTYWVGQIESKCFNPNFRFIISEQYDVWSISVYLKEFFGGVSCLFLDSKNPVVGIPNRLLPKISVVDPTSFLSGVKKKAVLEVVSHFRESINLVSVEVSDALISFLEQKFNAWDYTSAIRFDWGIVNKFISSVKAIKSKTGIDLDSYVDNAYVDISKTNWSDFEERLKNPMSAHKNKLP